ncbi:MAG: ATP-binding protein [Asgard group archaeon]|nr:ATP-binding protein [Asgard group archaeon]
MKFCETFFGKHELKLVDEDDLRECIIMRLQSGTVESSSIELKSYLGISNLKTKIPDITRNMVALANSVNKGGILILGIDEEGGKLTPFRFDAKRYDKDAIYQAMEARLLNENKESFEVHIIQSNTQKDHYYVLIEVEVKENSPYVWGYVPKLEHYPFVRKTEVGVENIPPAEIHLPRGFELQITYPTDTIEVHGYPERHSSGNMSSYLISIPITVKNLGIHPVKNVQVRLYIFCRYLTENDSLLSVLKEESIPVRELRQQELHKIIQQRFKYPLNVRYLEEYDGNLGSRVEITINEKFELAQGQTINLNFPIFAYAERLRKQNILFEIHITSNELGLKQYPITLGFLQYR